MQLQADQFVKFSFQGERGVEKEEGWVDRVYSNGQFVISDKTGTNPRRFEMCAVLDWIER